MIMRAYSSCYQQYNKVTGIRPTGLSTCSGGHWIAVAHLTAMKSISSVQLSHRLEPYARAEMRRYRYSWVQLIAGAKRCVR